MIPCCVLLEVLRPGSGELLEELELTVVVDVERELAPIGNHVH